MNQITIDELVAELDKIQSELPGATDGVTVQELVESWGMHLESVRKRLRALNKTGKLVTGRRRIKDISGRTNWSPVYRILREKGGRKK